jgi:hypothetical protein
MMGEQRAIAAVGKKPAALCALVAAGGDLDQPNKKGETPRMIATRNNVALPTADEIDAARRRIAKARLDLVRERAFQICLGLQSTRHQCIAIVRNLDAFVWRARLVDRVSSMVGNCDKGEALSRPQASNLSFQCTKLGIFCFRAVRHAPPLDTQSLPQSQTLTDVRDDGSTWRQ